jgi:myo-inositol-1(or 4)-monophosphatase
MAPPRIDRKPDIDAGIDARLAWAERTAAEVGELLLGGFRPPGAAGVAVERKTSGIVTEVDRRAERFIADSLAEAFPDDGMLAEEGTARAATSGYRWVVDPLDGTTNYASGLPLFTVSLACVPDRVPDDPGEPHTEPGAVIGVIHAPALGDTFTVVRGRGLPAGRRPPDALSDAVFIVNKAYHPASRLWAIAGNLIQSVRAFRMFGCVSLDLAMVAAGRADGLVLLGAEPWDVAAGLLLVEEAGLQVGDLAGEPHPDGRRGVLASGSKLFARAAGLLTGSPLAG